MSINWNSMQVLTAAVAMAGLPISAAIADGHIGGYVTRQFEDLQFQDTGNGVEIAFLWGDLETGPSAFMLRLPANFPGGMHTHSSDYQAVIVEGGSKHWIHGTDAADAEVFTPGDFWFQPADQVHQDANPNDKPVTLYLYFPGKFDVIFQ